MDFVALRIGNTDRLVHVCRWSSLIVLTNQLSANLVLIQFF